MPACDVVIVALKTTHNHLLPQLLPPVLKPHGVVLVLQNGLGVEPAVAQIVGTSSVMGGLCFLCSNKVGPGHISHLDYGQITLAEYGPDYQRQGITERMNLIAADLQRAGISVHLAADLHQARWQKLVWNIPFNGLSVVLDAKTDALLAYPATGKLVEALMQEVVRAAEACGVMIAADLIPTMLAATLKMKPYRTSMKIDFDQGRPLEIEAILGTPLRQGQAAGAPLPLLTMLYQQLTFLAQGHGA
jgi:2-dehydropantoate 2-reductase